MPSSNYTEHEVSRRVHINYNAGKAKGAVYTQTIDELVTKFYYLDIPANFCLVKCTCMSKCPKNRENFHALPEISGRFRRGSNGFRRMSMAGSRRLNGFTVYFLTRIRCSLDDFVWKLKPVFHVNGKWMKTKRRLDTMWPSRDAWTQLYHPSFGQWPHQRDRSNAKIVSGCGCAWSTLEDLGDLKWNI